MLLLVTATAAAAPCTHREWVDVDTPDAACTSVSGRDELELTLVFSDEFEREGRTFLDGQDSAWTSLEGAPYTNAQVNYYNESLAVCSLNGGQYQMGNIEERLKYKVIGTRRRGVPAMGAFNHTDGSGHVAAHSGDYFDCIENRKARLHLVCFTAGLGGMSAYARRRLPALEGPRGHV